MMLRFLTPNRAIVNIINALVVFWVAVLFVPAHYLRDVFNSLAFGASVIIVLTWGPSALQAVRGGVKTGEWQLILGIFLGWFVLMSQRLFSILFNYMGQPKSWLDGPFPAFWPYAYMICGFLFLLAPGLASDHLPVRRRTWAYLLTAVGIGAFVAGILLGASISTE